MSKRLRIVNSLAAFMILFGVVTTSIAAGPGDDVANGTACAPPSEN